jgi:hypothetical protein
MSSLRSFALASLAGLSAAALSLLSSCSKSEPAPSTYFSRSIAPILTSSCARTSTGAGCHVASPKGNAFGNLDVSSFEAIAKRRDLLLDYGPYGQPALLVKVVPDYSIELQSFDGQKVSVTTDVKHTGLPILDPTASGYQTLRRWIQNGASANNAGPASENVARQPCNGDIPGAPGFDATSDPPRADFAKFRDDARLHDAIRSSCAAGNCHGTQANDLYLTCGDSAEEVRWNYFAASQYLAQTPEASELLRRPLAPAQGGAYHEGGVVFDGPSDERYVALLEWARAHGPADFGALDPNFLFFAHRVQPILAKKGCMMVQCHSGSQFHDYRLRGGSGGSFSLNATRRNYDLSLAQLGVESPNVDASRLVRKNLFRPELAAGATGIAHRGGALFEDFGGTPNAKLCLDANYDYDGGDLDAIPAYCVVREWHERERAARKLAPMSAVVYVKRAIAAGSDRAQDFDVYRPGADLHVATVFASDGAITRVDADASVSAACGLDPATADIRRPQVSWDATRVLFAARSSAGEPLAIYSMNSDGTSCANDPDLNQTPATDNGLLVHNFDPVFAPPDDAGIVRVVFASTRGNSSEGPYDYKGAQRSPADPSKPNANLYVLEPDPSTGKPRVRQLTFLLDMERMPSFMSDGRVILTAEKRASGFYQLALRRVNLDGGDYHPLYAQRSSIGYHEATSVVELADKNFAAIFSDPGAAHGGGALGIFNRSLGVDFQSTNAADYTIDASVIDPGAPASPEPSFFLHSLRFVDPSVSGRPGAPTAGLYTSPAPLPGTSMLVSFGAATDAASFGGDYDLYVLDTSTGQKTKLLGDPGSAEIDAVAVYPRVSRGVFRSALDEPNGHTRILPGHPEAEILVHDVPVLASLLFQNTPTGRPLETFDSFEVWEELPPPLDLASAAAGGAGIVKDEFGSFFYQRRLLGRVPVASDGSAKFQIPGGLPILLKLPDTPESRRSSGALPRAQRETLSFAPGEYAHQSFRRDLFNGLCGSCHGSISGRPVDLAVRPDILTQASSTIAKSGAPTNLNVPPGQRGAVEGP